MFLIDKAEVAVKLNIVFKDPRLIKILEDYNFIFAEDIGELKRATHVKHVIDTGDAQPIRSAPYRVSFKQREIIEKEIKKMLDNKIIRPSFSPWSSPVVLVEKKDKSVRFCVDYRKLNAITKKDSQPLPNIDETIDALNNCSIFTKLDLRSGYWSISMDDKSREKTAFVTHMGLFEFEVLPFGLTNSPATFQRYLLHVINPFLYQFALVYIDDLIIYSKTIDDHLEHIQRVLERLAQHQLRLNPEKCQFASDTITYLGHVVSPEGVLPDPNTINDVKNFKRPTCVRDVRAFLGLTSYYRKFVKSYSQIAKPMNRLLKKDQKFIWSDECEQSYQTLKNKLISAPILAHFKPECPILLFTDSSGYAMGAILAQIQEGKEVVISYNSKSFDERQCNYSISEKECLAIVWGVQKLRPYLYGMHFTIKTDHCPLCYIMKVKNPNGRLIRWSMCLQDYDFTIEYKSGASHKNVDCLSRYPVEEPDPDIEDGLMMLAEGLNLVEAQGQDKWCSQIINELKEGKNKKYLIGYKMENDLLYKVIYKANHEPRLLLCVPKKLRRQILEELHDNVLSGHLGFQKTFTKIRERFYWNRMEMSVRKYVNSCKSCQERKPEPGLKKGELQPMEYPTTPFEMVSMDIMGSLTETPRKNRYIIVMMDYCTRWMEASPLKNMRSETIADYFVNQILVRHGAITKILTDQGRSFCSEFMENVFKLTAVNHLVTTPFHPACNGLVERSIRTLRSMMSHYANETHTNWDLYLNKLVFGYNTCKQSTTRESPFYLLYGREARLPIDVSFKLPERFKFGKKFKEELEECRRIVSARVEDAQQRQKYDYDKRHFSSSYNIGDEVMLYRPTRKFGKSEKLFRNYQGPYRIVKKIGKVSYELKSIKHPKRKNKRAHIQRLKKFHSGEIEGIDDEDPIETDDQKPDSKKKTNKKLSTNLETGDDQISKRQDSISQEKHTSKDDDNLIQDFSEEKQSDDEKNWNTESDTSSSSEGE